MLAFTSSCPWHDAPNYLLEQQSSDMLKSPLFCLLAPHHASKSSSNLMEKIQQGDRVRGRTGAETITQCRLQREKCKPPPKKMGIEKKTINDSSWFCYVLKSTHHSCQIYGLRSGNLVQTQLLFPTNDCISGDTSSNFHFPYLEKWGCFICCEEQRGMMSTVVTQ